MEFIEPPRLIPEVYLALLRAMRGSKSWITLMTNVANTYANYARRIGKVIVRYMLEATELTTKMSVLFLVDSITKCVRRGYVEFFEREIKWMFTRVFQMAKSDRTKRKLLYEMRKTWKSHFTPATLHSIDIVCKGWDPNWGKVLWTIKGNCVTGGHVTDGVTGVHIPTTDDDDVTKERTRNRDHKSSYPVSRNDVPNKGGWRIGRK